MTSTPDELIAGFPHFTLPKVTGETTIEDLKIICRLLNANSMSVSSYEGGTPPYHHDQRVVLRGRNRCVPTSQKHGTGGYSCGRDDRRTYS
jgi:hypothetical protein